MDRPQIKVIQYLSATSSCVHLCAWLAEHGFNQIGNDDFLKKRVHLVTFMQGWYFLSSPCKTIVHSFMSFQVLAFHSFFCAHL